MEGFPGDTPVVVKNINSSNKQILSLDELFKKLERKNSNVQNWRVWSPDGWNKIKELLNNGSEKIRVGIKPEGKIIARENTKIFSSANEEIGFITSGTFGPSVKAPVAMGYVKSKFSEIGTSLKLEIRGKKYEGKVSELPFYKKNYVK